MTLPRIIAILALGLCPVFASAHEEGGATLSLEQTARGFEGALALDMLDLDMTIGLDRDRDGRVTQTELTAAQPRISEAIGQGLEIRADGTLCGYVLNPAKFETRAGLTYLVTAISAPCPANRSLEIGYDMVFDLNTRHQAELELTIDGSKTVREIPRKTRRLAIGL